jgi:nitronate monooxygenase
MMSEYSNLPEKAKEFIRNNFEINTVSSNTTGKYARGIIAKFSEIENTQYSFPIQHYHTLDLRKLAKQNNQFDYASLWIGSNKNNLQTYSLSKLIELITKKSV